MKTVIYSKYSNERNQSLAIRTDILEDEKGSRYVQKLPIFPEGKAHVEKLQHWYRVFTEQCEGTKLAYNRCELLADGVELEYLTGESLEEHLLAVKKRQGIKECAAQFLDYLNLIQELHVGAEFEPTESFRRVFGDVKLPKGTACAPCSNIDLVCGNVLLTGETWTVIDYEWSFDFPIPVNYLLYRIIFYFTDHAGRGEEFREFDFLGKMGITQAEIKAFEEMETNLQRYVCRSHVPIRDLYEDISDGVFRVEETLSRQTLQVFFDYGEGCSEENSTTFSMDHWGIKAEIPLPPGVKALRVDPGSAAGLVELRRLQFDNQGGRAAFTLREGAVIGNWLYVGDHDPNILISEIPAGAESLSVDLNIHPVEEIPMGEIDRLAKEYVKQKRLLAEMQNTRVWKLYRKYRSHREK